MTLDESDRKLLNLAQDGIPLEARPFHALGRELGMTGAESIRRLKALVEAGLVRRIGPSFSPAGLGYATTLVAARINAEEFDRAVEFINGFRQVTHNYERNHYFNVWFTLIAADRDEIEDILDRVRRRPGVEAVVNLPSARRFKLQVRFDAGA